MAFKKFAADTQAAQAFAEAVSDEEIADESDNNSRKDGVPERLQRKHVSWSDSDNVEYADQVNELGMPSSRGPEVKAAALQRELSKRTGRHADMVKRAFAGKVTSSVIQAGKQALPKAFGWADDAARAGFQGVQTLRKGVKSKMPESTATDWGMSVGGEAAFAGPAINKL